MIKIKDNVDLSVLEKYGFKKCSKWYSLLINDDTHYIVDEDTQKIYVSNNYNKRCDTDILYDMIMDGICEKKG